MLAKLRFTRVASSALGRGLWGRPEKNDSRSGRPQLHIMMRRGHAKNTDRGRTEGDPRRLAQSSTLDGEHGRAVKVNRRKVKLLTITEGPRTPAGLRRQQIRSQRKGGHGKAAGGEADAKRRTVEMDKE